MPEVCMVPVCNVLTGSVTIPVCAVLSGSALIPAGAVAIVADPVSVLVSKCMGASADAGAAVPPLISLPAVPCREDGCPAQRDQQE